MIKEPRDYGAPVQTLKNGKTFVIAEVLAETEQKYKKTKRLFNLMQQNGKGNPYELSIGKPRRMAASGVVTKYSKEEAVWMDQHTAKEIAERFDVPVKRAYNLKYYAKKLHGL